MSLKQISAKELHDKLQNDVKPVLIDVREPYEYHYAHIKGSLLIPMYQIADKLNDLDAAGDYVLICHHGIRSLQVAYYMVHSGFSSIYNLMGGIDAWSVDCDNSVLRY